MKFKGLLCTVCSICCAVFICSSDAAVSGWTTPSLTAGSATLTPDEDVQPGDTITALLCTSDSSGTFTYAIASQPASAKLTIATADLNVAADKYFDYETETTYVLVVTCTDSSDSDVGTATITLDIQDVNEAPVFPATQYTVTIPDKSGEGTKLFTVVATDEDDANTVAYDIAGGNTNMDFTISASGVITVATGQTLAQSTTGGYELVVEANDNQSPSLTGTTTVWVAVTTCGASAVMVGVMTLILVAVSTLV